MSGQARKSLQTLLVEPDVAVAERLQKLVQMAGMEVVVRHNFQQGLSFFMRQNPDVVMANWQLDGLGGLALLRRVRTVDNRPFMVLKYHHPDRVAGHDEERLAAYVEGADDVVCLAVADAEIVARLWAILRRHPFALTRSAKNMALARQEGLQLEAHQVSWKNCSVGLTDTESQLLQVLVHYRGDVLSKPYLQLLVLNRPYVRHDRSIDMHVSNLRKKLRQIGHPADRIRAVRGYGYSYC